MRRMSVVHLLISALAFAMQVSMCFVRYSVIITLCNQKISANQTYCMLSRNHIANLNRLIQCIGSEYVDVLVLLQMCEQVRSRRATRHAALVSSSPLRFRALKSANYQKHCPPTHFEQEGLSGRVKKRCNIFDLSECNTL